MPEPTAPEPKATPGLARAVGPLEPFFDLVFVFAVSQLSHHLLTHLNWRGAGETAVLLVAVFSVWAYTSFEATSRDVQRKETQRTLLAVMFLGLFMNAAIGSAFSSSPWPFAVPYLISQIGPTVVTAVAVGPAELRHHYRRVHATSTARPIRSARPGSARPERYLPDARRAGGPRGRQ